MHSNGIDGKKDKLASRDSNEEKQFGMQFLHYKCLQKQRSTYVFYMLTVGDVCDKRKRGLRVIHKGFPEVNPHRSGVSQTQSISSLKRAAQIVPAAGPIEEALHVVPLAMIDAPA